MRLQSAATAALLIASPAAAQLAPVNDLGVTYAHVHLNVRDVDAAKLLFAEHFGGEIVVKGPLHTVKFPNFLVVFTEREPTGPSAGTVMDHFGFKVRDIDAALAAWEAAGLEALTPFTGAEGYKNAYVVTPDGARVELQEDPQLPVKASGYHIHFWHDEVEELMNWYADFFGAEIHPRGNIETTANVPGMNLSFGACRQECGPTQGRAIDHIGFEIDDIEEFVDRMQERGIEFQLDTRRIDSIELTIAFFTDPWGTYVELTEGFDEY